MRMMTGTAVMIATGILLTGGADDAQTARAELKYGGIAVTGPRRRDDRRRQTRAARGDAR
jgi:hypothetical protein